MILGMDIETRVAHSTGRTDRRYAPNRKRTISISVDPSLLAEIDAFTETSEMNRSIAFEEAARLFLSVRRSLTHTNGQSDAD